MAQALAEIAGHTAGKEIFISNNVPYIGRLNNGHSAQAPSGFVEMAVRRAAKLVEKSARGITD